MASQSKWRLFHVRLFSLRRHVLDDMLQELHPKGVSILGHSTGFFASSWLAEDFVELMEESGQVDWSRCWSLHLYNSQTKILEFHKWNRSLYDKLCTVKAFPSSAWMKSLWVSEAEFVKLTTYHEMYYVPLWNLSIWLIIVSIRSELKLRATFHFVVQVIEKPIL